MLHLLLLALVASLPFLVLGSPNLQYPLMAQMPPVARVAQPFEFNLLSNTFTSSNSLTYTTSSLPAWLSFSNPSLAFFGTPASTDQGEFPISLTANDGSGSIISNFTLIVTNNSAPGVHQAFTTQIADPSSRVFSGAKALPGNTGVSIPPGWSFSLGFASDTFRYSLSEPYRDELYSEARVRGMAGLPDWLQFNNDSMTFDGFAPDNGSYTVVVTGTDYWGYTGVQTSFVIEVGEGDTVEISKGTNFTILETIARGAVSYPVDLSTVLYNGKPATNAQVALALDNSDYPWLTLDASTNTITGTTPETYLVGTGSAVSVPITISSKESNNTFALQSWIPLDVLPYYFSTFTMPPTSVKPSEMLSFDLKQYLSNKTDNTLVVNATVSPKDAASWLVFYEDDMTLSGTAPKDVNYDALNITFTATADGFHATSDLSVDITGVKATNGSQNGTSSSSNTGSASSSSSGDVQTDQGSAPIPNASSGTTPTTAEPAKSKTLLSKGAKIGIAVALGVVGLIILAVILFSCCRRRRNRDEEAKTGKGDDGESFTVGSPHEDEQHQIISPRNFLGDIAKFSGLHFRSGPPPAEEKEQMSQMEKPARIGGLKGIFGWNQEGTDMDTPHPDNSSGSFRGQGDVIGVANPVDLSPGGASSFTNSLASSGSLASWESRESYRWSQGNSPPGNRDSTQSIPRPRENFTPRYPRNTSPTRLAQLASQHTVGSHDSSEIGAHSRDNSERNNGLRDFSSGSLTGSEYVRRPLDRSFRSIEEEDEDAAEGPAVVAMAERQPIETRRPTERHTPRLRPSKEQITTNAQQPPTEQSRSALAEVDEGMFDDADEKRQSHLEARDKVSGLGYPAAAIYYGRPASEISTDPSTLRAIPPNNDPLSPPLPHVGAFNRHAHRRSGEQGGLGDGRVHAMINETFSIHPQIHPPPSVSLSSTTWSSNPPSQYRAETQDGGQLPGWLHFDARELELWGVPSGKEVGDVFHIKIVEKMPRERKMFNPLAFGFGAANEREVGRLTIEVVNALRNPPTPTDTSPHAF